MVFGAGVSLGGLVVYASWLENPCYGGSANDFDASGDRPEEMACVADPAHGGSTEQPEFPFEKPVLDMILGDLPEQLAACLAMCLRNVVGFDFYAATFDWLKEVSLADLDATKVETACKLAVQAFRAQAFKGACRDELELMQLETELLVAELSYAYEFDVQGDLLLEAQKSGADELAVGRERQAAGTHLVDALSQVYWSAALRLVDVLIQVVCTKSKAKYEEELGSWTEKDGELREAVSRHMLQRPDEDDYPHRNLKKLLWRPVSGVG